MVVLLAEQHPQIPSEHDLRKGRTGISVWAAPAFLFSGPDAVDIQQPALSPGKASEFAMRRRSAAMERGEPGDGAGRAWAARPTGLGSGAKGLSVGGCG
jgi:hypothetical protein